MSRLSRRSVVLGAGGAGLALVGSGTLFSVTRTPATALVPWSAITTRPADVRLDAFRHAILAPNPHNRQPWLIELVGTDEAVVRCDLSRRLPETDPYDRQITVGFGCFLELARLAAAERGVSLLVEAFPEGAAEVPQRLDGRPVARLRFVSDGKSARDRLFGAIAARRSSKVPFDLSRPVAPDVLQRINATSEVRASGEAGLVERMRRLTWDAWVIEAETARTFRESIDLMRIGKFEIEANPDGIALGGPLLEAMSVIGLLSRDRLADPKSSAFKAGFDKYRPILASAMGFAWIETQANSRRDQLDAGRRYVRFNLAANVDGLSVHPVSQALQEFPEMAAPRRDVRVALGVAPGATLQMLARLGYAHPVGPSPRWPLEQKVIRK